MAAIECDFSEFEQFFDKLHKAASGDFKNALLVFLESLGAEFLDIVTEQIIQLEVVDTRLLLKSFKRKGKESTWHIEKGGLSLEVGTNVKYAKFVNDGHYTNPPGVKVRFIPGYWKNNRFVYDANAKSGMVLKQRWVKGKAYWDSAIAIMEKICPELLENKLQQWLNSYFS